MMQIIPLHPATKVWMLSTNWNVFSTLTIIRADLRLFVSASSFNTWNFLVSDYRAKVDNAAASGTSGLSWFKVAQDGLTSDGKWAVDRMIANGGWSYFNMPTCIAPGDYLLRMELIGLRRYNYLFEQC